MKSVHCFLSIVVITFLTWPLSADDQPATLIQFPLRAPLGNSMMAPATESPRKGEGLTLEVEFKGGEFMLGEPILVRCSLVNRTDKPITLSYGRAERVNAILFDIVGADGMRVPPNPIEVDSFGPQPLTIPSGQRFVDWYNLMDEYGLGRPGEYHISVHYKSDGRSFSSRTRKVRDDLWKGKIEHWLGRIQIKAPTHDADKVALQRLVVLSGQGQKPDSPFRLLCLFHKGNDKFLEDHAGSRYAVYAHYYAAVSPSWVSHLPSGPSYGKEALAHLEAIHTADLPPLLAEQRLFHLIAAHVSAKSEPQSIETLVETFLNRYPNSPFAHLLREASG